MIKLKNLLAANMRRFGTKNLSENIKSDPTHSPMAHLADALIPSPGNFVKKYGGNSKLGPNGEFDVLTKGDDSNGASIYYSSRDMKIYLSVIVNDVVKLQKEYPITAPNYLVDHKKILKDLGDYKTYKFKKTPNRG